MGERLILRAYKTGDAEAFRAALENVTLEHGGAVHWGVGPQDGTHDLRLSHTREVQTIYLANLGGTDGLLCRALGAALDVPWIELRVQEGSLWDYALYSGADHVHDFSTWPEYWESGRAIRLRSRPRPAELAAVWDVPVERIANYLRHRGYRWWHGLVGRPRGGKAYPDDEHEHGEIWQVYDLLRGLGGSDPIDITTSGQRHALVAPSPDRLRARCSSEDG